MAIYRPIHITYCQDKFVLSLTPEQKFFYLYLMINSKTKQCGIYELPKNVICFETGFNLDTVNKLLKIFIDAKKIKYDESNDEIFIINWIKYNPINNRNILSCVLSELSEIKTKKFIKELTEIIKKKNLGAGHEWVKDGDKKNKVFVDFSKEFEKEIKPLLSPLQAPDKKKEAPTKQPTETKTPTETPTETKTKQPTKTESAGLVGFVSQGNEKQFKTWWNFYNRREGDKEKIKSIFDDLIKTEEQYKDLITATRNYNDMTANKPIEYIKYPINFLPCYKDFLNIDN